MKVKSNIVIRYLRELFSPIRGSAQIQGTSRILSCSIPNSLNCNSRFIGIRQFSDTQNSRNNFESSSSEITSESVKLMCIYCFSVIQDYLKGINTPPYPAFLPTGDYPLFVTWKLQMKKRNDTKTELALRGCIGTFEKNSLELNLRKYALISAFQDYRFSPIKQTEIKNLECTVSLLHNFQKIDHPMDWEIAKHGLQIYFSKNGRGYASTFLPEVAEEQNWDKTKTLSMLIQKAGYPGSFKQLQDSIEVTRYESIKASASYADFIQATQIN